jgi:hypothetical protein
VSVAYVHDVCLCAHVTVFCMCVALSFCLRQENTHFEVCRGHKDIPRMKNGFFWDVTPCGSCKNRRFGGTTLAVNDNRRTLRINTKSVANYG